METKGIKVVAKFRRNPMGSGVISKTLGKIALIDKKYRGAFPQAGELWLVEITGELHPGEKRKGCFIIKPLKAIPKDGEGNPLIKKLVPGMYESIEEDGMLLVTPTMGAGYWIMPLLQRRKIKRDLTAIIVSLTELPND